MCNDCSCDSMELCSIVGMKPIGFCCNKCELYDEMKTCLKAKMANIKESKHLLPRSFCIKSKSKMTFPELEH